MPIESFVQDNETSMRYEFPLTRQFLWFYKARRTKTTSCYRYYSMEPRVLCTYIPPAYPHCNLPFSATATNVSFLGPGDSGMKCAVHNADTGGLCNNISNLSILTSPLPVGCAFMAAGDEAGRLRCGRNFRIGCTIGHHIRKRQGFNCMCNL
jgi:hypothetical protein